MTELTRLRAQVTAADDLNRALVQHNAEGAWCLVCGAMWDEANEAQQPHQPTCRIAEPRRAYLAVRAP